MTEILVVDDHPMIHEIAPHVVSKVFEDAEVYAASDLETGLECAGLCEALQLVLLDLTLPGCSGIDALLKFREKYPEARVVVLSAIEDPDCIQAAFRAGAVGYIPKTTQPELMVAALKVVAAGGKYVPSEILAGSLFDRTEAIFRS
jgi:DNA-binding NarL/FixJ family response regulator